MRQIMAYDWENSADKTWATLTRGDVIVMPDCPAFERDKPAYVLEASEPTNAHVQYIKLALPHDKKYFWWKQFHNPDRYIQVVKVTKAHWRDVPNQ